MANEKRLIDANALMERLKAEQNQFGIIKEQYDRGYFNGVTVAKNIVFTAPTAVQRWTEGMRMIDLYPTKCNICGGSVVFTSNATIYGKEYGSGKCYVCQSCGAYTGTHRPRPKEALGLLADEPMRKGKIACHHLFDTMWKGKKKAQKKRKDLYSWLANAMGISVEECHFGYFDILQLRKAYGILIEVSSKEMLYDNNGNIYFCSYGERREGE